MDALFFQGQVPILPFDAPSLIYCGWEGKGGEKSLTDGFLIALMTSPLLCKLIERKRCLHQKTLMCNGGGCVHACGPPLLWSLRWCQFWHHKDGLLLSRRRFSVSNISGGYERGEWCYCKRRNKTDSQPTPSLPRSWVMLKQGWRPMGRGKTFAAFKGKTLFFAGFFLLSK